MENLEYIDDFFRKQLPADQKAKFERRILDDPAFAEEVAFYVSAKQIARDEVIKEKKKRFRDLYENTVPVRRMSPLRRLAPFAVAASVLAGVLLIWFMYANNASPHQLADAYIRKEFATLGVTMDASPDSMQQALISYNQQQYDLALHQFESILQSAPKDFTAIKYAGIVSLRTEQYDKALTYFNRLGNEPGLFANPGKFYAALTYLKRDKKGDRELAKQLLNEVVRLDLEGKDVAAQWLRHL